MSKLSEAHSWNSDLLLNSRRIREKSHDVFAQNTSVLTQISKETARPMTPWETKLNEFIYDRFRLLYRSFPRREGLDEWVVYRVCDTRRYQTPVMGNVRKYRTHFVLYLFVRIYIDLAFAKFGVKLQQSSLSLLLSTTIVAEWKIINDSDTVGWISKTYLSLASFSKRALFFVNVSGC